MRMMAPTAAELADHTGKPRATLETPLSYEQARLGTAFHEAGHAVLALAYGMHVVDCEVIAWEPVPGRFAVAGRTGHHADGTPPWRFAAQCAAGEQAHVTYLMTCGLWTPERAAACAAEHDREYAIDMLAAHGYTLGRDHVPPDGKSWSMVRGIARRKMTQLWPEICLVARALDAQDWLSGDAVAEMTGLCNAPRMGGA